MMRIFYLSLSFFQYSKSISKSIYKKRIYKMISIKVSIEKFTVQYRFIINIGLLYMDTPDLLILCIYNV